MSHFPDDADAVLGAIEKFDPASTGQDPERIGYAIAAMAHRHGIDEAISLATIDWRDLLVIGGVAYPDWREVLDQELGSASS